MLGVPCSPTLMIVESCFVDHRGRTRLIAYAASHLAAWASKPAVSGFALEPERLVGDESLQ